MKRLIRAAEVALLYTFILMVWMFFVVMRVR